MELRIKGHLNMVASYNNGHTTLTLKEEDLLKLQEAIDFHYFDQDFHNFLELEHEPTCFANGCELSTLKRFWELYKDAQDVNIAEWDTYKSVYEAAKSVDGFWWPCSNCGCDIFGELPKVDADGNVYCDVCAEEVLGYCDYCDQTMLHYKLYSVNRNEKFICEECLHQGIENGTLELKETEEK